MSELEIREVIANHVAGLILKALSDRSVLDENENVVESCDYDDIANALRRIFLIQSRHHQALTPPTAFAALGVANALTSIANAIDEEFAADLYEVDEMSRQVRDITELPGELGCAWVGPEASQAGSCPGS